MQKVLAKNRYSHICNEIENRTIRSEEIEKGIIRFIIGLAKKVLIADYLAEIADGIFATCGVSEISMTAAWVGAICYTLQIYFDFSGYSDMAIGLGLSFGFHFDENFNYPYISTSITEFWRRWHISLTSWFRDYVYIPLGGNRVSVGRHIFNLFIVWLFTGIWHGANYTFVIWGMAYFVLQVFEKYCLKKLRVPKVIGWIYTFLIVNFLWVVFKADTVSLAIKYLRSMFNFSQIYDEKSVTLIFGSFVILVIALIGMTPLCKKIGEKILVKWKPVGYLFIMGIYILSLLCIIAGAYSPFVYFNF